MSWKTEKNLVKKKNEPRERKIPPNFRTSKRQVGPDPCSKNKNPKMTNKPTFEQTSDERDKGLVCWPLQWGGEKKAKGV